MSAMNEVFLCLLALGVIATGVLLWVFWPTEQRVRRAAAAVSRRRRGETVTRVDAVAPTATDVVEVLGALLDAEEAETGDTPQPESGPVDEPTFPNGPMWWVQPPAARTKRWLAPLDEPTPIFHSAGRYPQFDELETFTNSWNRADLQRHIREVEAQQAGVEAA